MDDDDLQKTFPSFDLKAGIHSPTPEERAELDEQVAKRQQQKDRAKAQKRRDAAKVKTAAMTDNNNVFTTPVAPVASATPLVASAAGDTLAQMLTAKKAATDAKTAQIKATAAKKLKRVHRKQAALLKVGETLAIVAKGHVTALAAIEKNREGLDDVKEGLRDYQSKTNDAYDEEDAIQEEEGEALLQVANEYDAYLETLYLSTPGGSAVASPASSQSSSRSSSRSNSFAETTALPRDLLDQFDNESNPAPSTTPTIPTQPTALTTITTSVTPKRILTAEPPMTTGKTPKRIKTTEQPSPVLEDKESKMPVLTTGVTAIALMDRRSKNFDVIDLATIAKPIGNLGPGTPVVLGMEQVGKLTFVLVGSNETDSGGSGKVLCLGPPGFFAHVGHTLVGRSAAEFQTEIHALNGSENVVSLSAYSKGEQGVLATLDTAGNACIYTVLDDKKVKILESFEKADWLPEDDDSTNLELATIQMGCNFAVVMDNQGGFHVMDLTGTDICLRHFANDAKVCLDGNPAGLATGEDSILAWGDKIERKRARRVFFLSKSNENPWENVLTEIKGVTAQIGVASKSGFLALGANGVAYVKFDGGWKRVNWGDNKVVKTSLIAASDDCFLAVPDGMPGKVMLVSSQSPTDPKKKKQLNASLVDVGSRLAQAGKPIKEVLLLAGSSLRIGMCIRYNVDTDGEADSAQSQK